MMPLQPHFNAADYHYAVIYTPGFLPLGLKSQAETSPLTGCGIFFEIVLVRVMEMEDRCLCSLRHDGHCVFIEVQRPSSTRALLYQKLHHSGVQPEVHSSSWTFAW